VRRIRRGCSQAALGVLAAAAACLLAGCGLIGGPRTVHLDVPDVMTVTSPDVSGGVLSHAFTCQDFGKHPALHWSGVPQGPHGAKSIAVVMDDSAAPISPHIYWIAFDIGPQTTDILPGPLPAGIHQAYSSKGTPGYDPPCPENQGHNYRFTVYALSRTLNLPARSGLKSTWSAIARDAIARGRLTAAVNP
jgi:Raf kinase inhibitor-like YbhB/YbcL family protein